jgi:uncharacterized protein
MAIAFVVGISVLLGLLFFLQHEMRRWPGPPQWGRPPVWNKRIRVTMVSILLLIASLAFWAFLIEPNRLIVNRQTIEIGGWPSELNSLKVAVISDIHAGGWFINDAKLRSIVECTNQLQPDLIVVLGDYMTGNGWTSQRVEPEVFAAVLKDFHAPLGTYSVLGNHDWWYNGQRVRQALENNGIKVLEDEVVEIKRGRRSLWLAGLADFWTRPQHIEETIGKVPQGEPVIALTHNPDIFPSLPQRVPLLLAGHTHGGQVRLPFIGTAVVPSDYGDRYAAGHLFENEHHLFVTTGIGTSIVPVRLGVTPEIVLLTLKSQ